MEAFSQMIEWAVEGGFQSACRVGGRVGEEVKVSHLLFITPRNDAPFLLAFNVV